jgi:hypothetical protein
VSREARALTALRNQINAAYPNRSKVSDGGIADARHIKAGASDHIPDRDGVYHARDFTHCPQNGFDSYEFANRLLAAQDPRLKYLISNGRIGSGPTGPQPGRWRKYTGANKHDHHVHVSVVGGPMQDDDRPWAGIVPPPIRAEPSRTTLATGSPREDDDLNSEQDNRLKAVEAKLDTILGQFGYNQASGGWDRWEAWDGSKRKLTLLDLLRETHRELLQKIPGRAPANDTILGHVLNIARKIGADGR